MKDLKELVVHAGLLVTASLLAFSVYTMDEKPTKAAQGPVVEVWGGKTEQVERIDWEGKAKVSLEARKDKGGRYYVTTVVKTQQILKPNAPDAEVKSTKPEEKTLRFVSIEAAKPLIEAVAPLKAYRALGNYDEARAADFGFEDAEGTLRVTIGGKVHSLVVGGQTPGGGDRYARDPDTNTLYAVTGELVRNLTSAEQRLFERELHAFPMEDIDGLRVAHGGATRGLARVEGKEETWADAASPTVADETATNWVSKLTQLRPSEYFEQPPPGLGPESVIVRVEYLEGRRERGYLELAEVAGEKGPRYLVRTEHTRWYAEVLKSTAEQVEQDVASVVRR